MIVIQSGIQKYMYAIFPKTDVNQDFLDGILLHAIYSYTATELANNLEEYGITKYATFHLGSSLNKELYQFLLENTSNLDIIHTNWNQKKWYKYYS